MIGALVLFAMAGCAPDLTGVQPLPAQNGYRNEPWVQHPDNPFTKSVGGHTDGSRYIYYNDPLSRFDGVFVDEPPLLGAIVVKEVYDLDVELRYIAVMRRLPDHPDAERDGWLYSISRDNGETEQLSSVCKNCHIDKLSHASLWILPPT